MMQRHPALVRGISLKHREINDPHRCPAICNEASILANFYTQGAKGIVNDACFVRAEEDQIAAFRTRALDDAAHYIVGQELEYGRLQTVTASRYVVDFDVRKASC